MIIYSMTATFGKLEHATLELQPGFNLLQAPNEWGKSTWCSFLTAMFYGLDTRAKSTKTVLADKERYAPWSGSPMSGRMDLCWNGRDITIERTTKGRIPMGEFRAYETETGLTVPELNGANCGTVLLGVERSVFLRSAFIRLNDLPVTQDEALRRRLNALVSTGDEGGADDRLAKGLRDLKNKCRYHKTGLIPQAEAECAALEQRLGEMERLEQHSNRLKDRLEECNLSLARLENHKNALNYAAAQADARHVAQAQLLRDRAAQQYTELEQDCRELPGQDQIQWALGEIRKLEQDVQALEMESRMHSWEISWPEAPGFLEDRTPEEGMEKAKADALCYEKLTRKRYFWPVFGGLVTLAGAGAAYWYRIPGLLGMGIGAVILLLAWLAYANRKRAAQELITVYRSSDPYAWVAEARHYRDAMERSREQSRHLQQLQEALEYRAEALDRKIIRMTQGRGLTACREDWESAQDAWDALAGAGRELNRAEQQLQTLKAMARTAQPPEHPDELTCTEEETLRLLADSREERRQLEARLGQYAGNLEALGEKAQLEKQLEAVKQKLAKLEQTYAALTIAQETLARATAELQRRFAPRISRRACELMSRMTGGRYDRVQLGEDFSLLTGAEQEDVLQNILWRSDGTVDQLYLALRLAVAEELTPNAPLILDDALVRFDDVRLKAALEILREEAKEKQVILFSCQSREANMA